ncbi:MAG: hypothetical protein IKF18_07085 [Erysipelotrichaceae bacterium]|nr:hypothetical protein [Erysipelotrichaceae bacterium]
MEEVKVYSRASSIPKNPYIGFCPGCMHSTTFKVIAEVLDELGIVDKTIECNGVGCSGLGLGYVYLDNVFCAHGRACAVATGIKRTNPDNIVFTYQGDGDGGSIGIAETIYAANRGENITMILINNGTYGMTGGQMAPTTLVGQKATTAPWGRNPEEHGYPVHIAELLDSLTAPAYIARVAMNSVQNVRKAKACIKKAFQYQMEGKGFSYVEVMSNCPTNWGMSPLETLEYMEEHTLKEFKLGEIRAK